MRLTGGVPEPPILFSVGDPPMLALFSPANRPEVTGAVDDARLIADAHLRQPRRPLLRQRLGCDGGSCGLRSSQTVGCALERGSCCESSSGGSEGRPQREVGQRESHWARCLACPWTVRLAEAIDRRQLYGWSALALLSTRRGVG